MSSVHGVLINTVNDNNEFPFHWSYSEQIQIGLTRKLKTAGVKSTKSKHIFDYEKKKKKN